MIRLNNSTISLYIFLLIGPFFGCKKYLETKPDIKLVVPNSIIDLQAILDNYQKVNKFGATDAEVSSDNYYLSDADWAGLTNEGYRRMYIWENDRLFTSALNTWGRLYDVAYIANTALLYIDNLPKSANNVLEWNNVKGQGLYLRAQTFLQAASIWSLAYDPLTASSDLGIPLRLDPDFNRPSVRSSVKDTYEQIIKDLKMAIPLLPIKPLHVMRASKPAAYGLLARTHLYMRDYVNAGLYADSCLQIKDNLIDYNTLKSSDAFPFTQFNDEVIVENYVPAATNLANNRAKIDPDLYLSYQNSDLRKSLFFTLNNDGSVGFKGSYEGNLGIFGGIATDEVYLMRAECYARDGKIKEAMDDLNTLLKTRWSNKVVYNQLTATNVNEALDIILTERRKELIYRCIRWMDIKRLNQEGANIILTRVVKGVTYTLKPKDLRFALPIPEDVIFISGMTQNPR